MKSSSLFSFLSLLVLTIFVSAIFAIALRGMPGNPSAEAINSVAWTKDGPFELSPERGRFALVYSIMEDKSLQFTLPIAQFSRPDLAYSSAGKYVSLFAPGVSFLVLPGYFIGKIFGAQQVGTYAVVSLFAVINFLLIRAIAIKLGAEKWAALLGAMTFSFASPAFAYGVVLYQHHFTVFFMLLSLFLLIKYKNFWSLWFVWFVCGFSIVIDNPNLFLMLPVMAFSFWRAFELISVQKGAKKIIWSIFKGSLIFFAIIPSVAFFLWYNWSAYGKPFQLPGTLPSVAAIGEDGKPAYGQELKDLDSSAVIDDKKTSGNFEKTAIGFFETRNLYNGFYEHFISLDRGVINFTPVLLLGIAGFIVLYRRSDNFVSLFFAIVGFNVLLYSMWGDPYGGWAFGSRYLIPSYAIFAIALAVGLSQWKKRGWLMILFVPLFVYSAWVNSLGALTTNANPPRIQVLSIEKQTGHEQKYTFIRNWEFLHGAYGSVGSKSFIFSAFAKKYITASQYQMITISLILALAFLGGSLSYYLDNRPLNKTGSRNKVGQAING